MQGCIPDHPASPVALPAAEGAEDGSIELSVGLPVTCHRTVASCWPQSWAQLRCSKVHRREHQLCQRAAHCGKPAPAAARHKQATLHRPCAIVLRDAWQLQARELVATADVMKAGGKRISAHCARCYCATPFALRASLRRFIRYRIRACKLETDWTRRCRRVMPLAMSGA